MADTLDAVLAKVSELSAITSMRMAQLDRYREALERIADDEHATDQSRVIAKVAPRTVS
jgi:hypothetical protein